MTEESQQRKALRQAVIALMPFMKAIEYGEKTITNNSTGSMRIGHVIRAASCALSYHDFMQAAQAITAAEKALGGKE
jgi:hypothetical protein